MEFLAEVERNSELLPVTNFEEAKQDLVIAAMIVICHRSFPDPSFACKYARDIFRVFVPAPHYFTGFCKEYYPDCCSCGRLLSKRPESQGVLRSYCHKCEGRGSYHYSFLSAATAGRFGVGISASWADFAYSTAISIQDIERRY